MQILYSEIIETIYKSTGFLFVNYNRMYLNL